MSVPVPAAVVAAQFARRAATASRQTRGITAKAIDRAVVAAKADASAKWGDGPSARSIRGRMSRTEQTVGYLLVDGGGSYQETGTGHHPPNPVLGPAAESVTDWLASELAELFDPFS